MSEHSHTEEKVTFGFWVYLMSDCVLFAALFATYAVLRGATFDGPTMAEIVSLPFVLGETLILLASTLTIGVALLAARASKTGIVIGALLGTLVLGAAFLTMELREFAHLIAEGHSPSTNAFFSAFFTLVGTHGAHVAAGILWMLVILGHVIGRGLQPGVVRKLACLALFWHFLDIVWIFIFTFVYLFGALSL